MRMAQGTDSLRLLRAFAAGAMYYDPGIKLENASTKPKVKPRRQFRVASKNIGAAVRQRGGRFLAERAMVGRGY